MSAATEHGEERVTDGAFEWAAGQAAVGFHVADFGLDDAAAAEVCDEFERQSAPCAADQ